MLATKNRSRCGIILFLALAVFLAGCGPPGPRALLKGKKLLDRGDYSDAVEKFKTATSLMSTNAQAWNYLGVAYQHAGDPADAALAYQRALTLDRDLVEAHYNLGCLWLAQNRPDVARTEFTAYVLRNSKDATGWTKLGVAQLRLRDLTGAEKSFSIALSIDSSNAEALNGLGLAQMQRGRPREAAQYFAAATRAQPDFAPAVLNLATVERQYLRNDALALQYYRAYLALVPHREDWDQVNTIANNLEQKVNGAVSPVESSRQDISPPARVSEQKTQWSSTTEPRTDTRLKSDSARESESSEATEVRPTPAPNSFTITEPPRQTNEKQGAFHQLNPLNWFRTASSEPKITELTPSNANNNQAKPEPGANVAGSGTPMHTQTRPLHLVQPPQPSFPRYAYLSPSKPRPGDRPAAERAFALAQQFERDRHYEDAMDSYREASQLDPSWFEAQYDCGVVAYRLGDFNLSLRAYEMALAIRPGSEDARYNFALALKAAGYATDAANELKKILASNPNDVRAHLALGNLYAQQLYDFAQARVQYLKVLELDPGNSQAADIQFWLSANPP
ncbi:MAG TPA: tetratricopeptide repeat protein [Candidatus Saccharimonadales bacterium]|nr:tetratricopeptide repeat protein [Candidatus Saccharimonadales bacterium]